MAYNFPTPQTYLTKSWLKYLNLDVVETVKILMILGKNICMRPSREYETSTLHTTMLNKIFRRANGKNFKIGWVPVIFFVATQGTIFNWENIVSNSLSACISATLEGFSQKKT